MIDINKEKCTGCGICERICPFAAVKVVDKLAVIGDECTLCGACVPQCSEGAITITRKKVEEKDFSAFQDVWIVAEKKGDKIRNVSYELLGKAIELAAELNQKPSVVLIGKDVKQFAQDFTKMGAKKVYVAEHEDLERFSQAQFQVLRDNKIYYGNL